MSRLHRRWRWLWYIEVAAIFRLRLTRLESRGYIGDGIRLLPRQFPFSAGNFHKQLALFIRECRQHRQIAPGRAVGNVAGRVKGRAVARTIKSAIGFGGEFAFAMGANRGERKQLSASADDEESLLAKPRIHAIGGVIRNRTGVDGPFRLRRGNGVNWH